MNDNITQYTRRPARYEHLDGTADLGFGIWFLAFALIGRSSKGVTTTWHWFVMVYATLGIVWAVVHFATRYIRRRLVYPRSGYVKLRKRPWLLATATAVSAVTAAALVLSFAKTQSVGLSPPLIAGLLIGLGALIGALWHRVRKLLAFAMLSVGIGFVLQFIEPTLVSGMFWYFLLMGVAFIISGVLTLYFYVRRTPPRNLDAE
jgi:hypothetical protein